MSHSFKAELLLVNSLLHVWNETKVNGPLGSVFSACNSVLLTLNISDEKGKQTIPVSKAVKQALSANTRCAVCSDMRQVVNTQVKVAHNIV